MRFTQSRIAALQCPAGKRDALFFDDEQRGLGVRVMASGSKSFLVQYTAHGQKRRVPLGSCAAISLARAREAARVILGEVAKGADPAQDRKATAEAARQRRTREALTLGALIAEWGSIHLSNRRTNYATAAVRSLRYAFAPYLDVPAAEIDRAVIVRVLDGMSGAGKRATAAQTAAYGKAAYNWAMQRGAVPANPFAGIPVPRPVERDRVLTDSELAAVWRASESAGTFGRIVQMLILTGQRREEVGGMASASFQTTSRYGRSRRAVPRMASPISCRCQPRRRRTS